jgi:hypothetical protein
VNQLSDSLLILKVSQIGIMKKEKNLNGSGQVMVFPINQLPNFFPGLKLSV